MAKPKMTGPQRQRKPPKRGKRRYTVSDAVRRANKLNAQRTRSRKTLEGLMASSMNALKHARYAETDPGAGNQSRFKSSERNGLGAGF